MTPSSVGYEAAFICAGVGLSTGAVLGSPMLLPAASHQAP